MKREFESQYEAIEWLAQHAEDETQFEVLREELNFNHMYTGRYFFNWRPIHFEIQWLDNESQ